MEQLTLRDDDGRALFTPYGLRIYCSTQATADCICKLEEALKAQEPRVLTLEELRQLEHTDHIIWIEANGDPESFDGYAEVTTNIVTKDIELFVPGNEVEFIPDNKNYGKTWRCWSSKPTDEQREAVKWDTN